MTLTRRTFLHASATALAVSPLAAQTGPLSGISRIINGFPAGGTVDTTTRRLAEAWRGKLAESLVVENRPGAGGRIAINGVKDQAPDGRTLLVSPDSMLTIYPSVYRRLGYDPAVDVTPVSSICSLTFAFGIGPAVPANVRTLADFVAWARANSAGESYGSPAAGSMPHFLGDVFLRSAGISPKHVPYRGSAPAIADLIGGHLPSCLTVLGEFLPHAANPAMRILAVADKERSKFLPNVPTFAEQGFDKVLGVETFGLFLPRGASPDLVARVNMHLREAVAEPATVEGLTRIGMTPAAVTPDAYRAHLDRERQAWGPIVRASGFSLEE